MFSPCIATGLKNSDYSFGNDHTSLNKAMVGWMKENKIQYFEIKIKDGSFPQNLPFNASKNSFEQWLTDKSDIAIEVRCLGEKAKKYGDLNLKCNTSVAVSISPTILKKHTKSY